MQRALLVSVLAGLACGVMGSFIVARRITYLAGGISHSVLGGIGLFQYIAVVRALDWLDPIYGALLSGLMAAVIIGYASLRAKEREDTVIGALWATGMAIGILFMSLTPGYNQDLTTYLFGNVLIVSSGDLILVAILDAAIIGTSILFYRKLVAVCYDQEFARSRGINVEAYYILLLCMTALTVVVLVTVVGIVLVIALLVLPAAIAMRNSRSISTSMIRASVIAILLCVTGLAFSYSLDLPAGATIILLSGLIYLLSAAYSSIRLSS